MEVSPGDGFVFPFENTGVAGLLGRTQFHMKMWRHADVCEGFDSSQVYYTPKESDNRFFRRIDDDDARVPVLLGKASSSLSIPQVAAGFDVAPL